MSNLYQLATRLIDPHIWGYWSLVNCFGWLITYYKFRSIKKAFLAAIILIIPVFICMQLLTIYTDQPYLRRAFGELWHGYELWNYWALMYALPLLILCTLIHIIFYIINKMAASVSLAKQQRIQFYITFATGLVWTFGYFIAMD